MIKNITYYRKHIFLVLIHLEIYGIKMIVFLRKQVVSARLLMKILWDNIFPKEMVDRLTKIFFRWFKGIIKSCLYKFDDEKILFFQKHN